MNNINIDQPENILVHESNNDKRTSVTKELVERLITDNWTVFVFTNCDINDYAPLFPNSNYIRFHTEIDGREISEIIELKKFTNDRKVAVVLHGIINLKKNKNINRLLKDTELMIIIVTSIDEAKNDHRFKYVYKNDNWEIKENQQNTFSIVDENEVNKSVNTNKSWSLSNWIPW